MKKAFIPLFLFIFNIVSAQKQHYQIPEISGEFIHIFNPIRTGPDLLHWSGPKIVHVQPYKVDWGGDAESPFVIHKEGWFISNTGWDKKGLYLAPLKWKSLSYKKILK